MAVTQKVINNLELGLDDFDLKVRRENLKTLYELVLNGDFTVETEQESANLHCHSFFSYNGYGYSPTHLAWLGKKMGIKFMGVVDFDVLDGVDEFLNACAYLGIRGSAGMETRVFIPEFADVEINSPGEPGICYHMGIGFTSSNASEYACRTLGNIRQRVAQRNCRILEKINQFLDPLIIDFERDILPLTPSGNATERHIVTKIVNKSFTEFENPAQFWSGKLEMPVDLVEVELADLEGFQNTLRKKLIKRGGIGYIQPTADTFPLIDEFYKLLFECQAIPCAAWLDGTSPGEQAIEDLLDVLISKGTAAINIIPDRNWNIQDAKEKAIKIKNLYHVVRVAAELNLPIMAGTEMNSFGQQMVDDFNIPELAPLKKEFINGAFFIYGHTQMQEQWKMGYQSPWAQKYFDNRKSKNDFYIKCGQLITPGEKIIEGCQEVNTEMTPEQVLICLK